MTGFSHGITGAVIALTIKQPVVAIPLAFFSHFVADTIPHWNYGVSREEDQSGMFFTKRFKLFLLVDFLLASSLMIILAIVFPTHKWLIWGCMIAAASPDLMWAYYRLYTENIKGKKPNYDPLARFHILVQWSQTSAGLFVEIAWVILFSLMLIIIKNR